MCCDSCYLTRMCWQCVPEPTADRQKLLDLARLDHHGAGLRQQCCCRRSTSSCLSAAGSWMHCQHIWLRPNALQHTRNLIGAEHSVSTSMPRNASHHTCACWTAVDHEAFFKHCEKVVLNQGRTGTVFVSDEEQCILTEIPNCMTVL